MTDKLKSKVSTAKMKVLRIIKGVTGRDIIRNTQIRGGTSERNYM